MNRNEILRRYEQFTRLLLDTRSLPDVSPVLGVSIIVPGSVSDMEERLQTTECQKILASLGELLELSLITSSGKEHIGQLAEVILQAGLPSDSLLCSLGLDLNRETWGIFDPFTARDHEYLLLAAHVRCTLQALIHTARSFDGSVTNTRQAVYAIILACPSRERVSTHNDLESTLRLVAASCRWIGEWVTLGEHLDERKSGEIVMVKKELSRLLHLVPVS